MPKIDPEKEAADLLREIERKFPPERCTLPQYREVLDNLRIEICERINQVDEEISDG